MAKLKLILGFALIIWACFSALVMPAAVIFFPEMLQNSNVTHDMQESRAYMLNNPSFILSCIWDGLLDNFVPAILGIILVTVSIDRMKNWKEFIVKITQNLGENKNKLASSLLVKGNEAIHKSNKFRNPKKIARSSIILGVLFLGWGAFMDVSVDAGIGTRIINIGLLSERQMLLTIGAIFIFSGLLYIIFSQGGAKQERITGENITENEWKKCLFCAEQIRAEAVKCRFCSSELPPYRP